MSDPTFKNPEPYARFVPSEGPPADHVAPHTVEQGGGFIELGFIIDGAYVPLARPKAPGILADIARAAAAAPKRAKDAKG